MPLLLLCTDLIFSTKILSTARSLNIPVLRAATPAAITDQLGRGGVTLAILDLSLPNALDLLRTLKSHPTPPKVIAFLSHVEADLARLAREAGADQVLARSAFAAQIPALLTS